VLLQSWESIAVAAMQVGDGFLALVQQLAGSVGNLELQGDCGVFSDVHAPNYRKKPYRLCAEATEWRQAGTKVK